MGFSGAAPEEKAVASAPAVSAPAVTVVSEDEDIIAVLSAAVAACDGGGGSLASIGRLTGSQSWTNYARIAAVTNRDQMF